MDRPNIEVLSIFQVGHESSWIDLLVDYISKGILPNDPIKARSIKRQALWYILQKNNFYKKFYSLLLLRCLIPYKADYALREVHEGICENHLGGRSLAYKVIRQDYYWPTIQKDAADLINKCDQDQRYANIQHQPATELISITVPWPFII